MSVKRYFVIIVLVLLLLVISGCNSDSKKNLSCESYHFKECPEWCGLCGDTLWSSNLRCTDKEYCDLIEQCPKSETYICDQNPGCRVCPNCETCSAISCLPATYCERMGFGSDWYETIKNSDNAYDKS